MRRTCLVAGLAVALIAGCGGDDGPDGAATTATTGQGIRGERVIAGAGCLACHQLGERGRPGPGDNLDAIGSRRTPAQIRRALLSPKAPMPSYRRRLSQTNFDALVAYLASLHGDCPAGGDCG
jgi:mono/diheme cytochrome c family protein